MTTRRSARIASKRQYPQTEEADIFPASKKKCTNANALFNNDTDAASSDGPELLSFRTASDSELSPPTSLDFQHSSPDVRSSKRRKKQPRFKSSKKSPSKSTDLNRILQAILSPPHPLSPRVPSHRTPHPMSYHHPKLLSSKYARESLLQWFDSRVASQTRPMPWRKPFLLPSTTPPADIERRAYEVWISETMLQQTRVSTVIPYWEKWISKWPTAGDLARAEKDEVLSVWRGLGYYARARRLLEAAKAVCAPGKQEGERLPRNVEGWLGLPGVGRYTAGAVTAITFGVPAAMVDGNVLRVLSRQMGIYGDVKGDRRVVELVWRVAEELVKVVSREGSQEPNDRPGRWGQALMELGSTLCMPRPECGRCPISVTCRVYEEGLAIAEGNGTKGVVGDIEDGCELCQPFEEGEEDGKDVEENEQPTRANQSKMQQTLSRFFAPKDTNVTDTVSARTLGVIISHAKKFPYRPPKKTIRAEETLVCVIRRSDCRYLIQRRPDKGLLAGMWEFPSQTLNDSNKTAKSRKARAAGFVKDNILNEKRKVSVSIRHVGELGTVPWQFSHLSLTMHVHLFELNEAGLDDNLVGGRRWATIEEIEQENMGTGMRKCWTLVHSRVLTNSNP